MVPLILGKPPIFWVVMGRWSRLWSWGFRIQVSDSGAGSSCDGSRSESPTPGILGGLPKVGVPFWGSQYEGIKLLGVYIWVPLFRPTISGNYHFPPRFLQWCCSAITEAHCFRFKTSELHSASQTLNAKCWLLTDWGLGLGLGFRFGG